jgi:hypothetical protein
MAEPAEFERRIQSIGVRVAEGGDRIVRMAFLKIDQAVVLATPVDKGTARSNWLPGFDNPVSGQREAFVPGTGGSTGGANAQAAMNAAKELADGYDGDQHKSLHLTNNLPYIARLNEGSSTQAPELFVETAVGTAVGSVRGAKVLD